MSIKIVLFISFCLLLTHQLCINSSQREGQCTQCGPLDVLIKGNCYIKIRGCLRHEVGPKCIQCQFGYVLSNITCIRQAVFFNRTDKQIPPVKINIETVLTIAEIKDKLGQKYGAYFSDAHDYFLGKYSNDLGKGLIKNVQRIQTKKGAFIIIEYLADSQKSFSAIALVESLRNVKQISFLLSGIQRKDPYVADLAIRAVLGEKLKDFFIYQLKIEGQSYTFDYMNSKFENIRIIVNKNDIDNPNLISKISVNTFGLTNLAVQELVALYPQYKTLTVVNVRQYEPYYVLTLGTSVQVSFTFKDFRFIINKPIFISNSVAPPTNQTILGGYNPFTNYTDPRFISSIQYAAKELPELIGAQVTKVQYQIVAGINFLISLKKAVPNSTIFDLYELKIFYSLSSTIEITEAKKNNDVIFSLTHNYNQDPTFFNALKIVPSASNITNIPPIDRVIFKNLGSKLYYKIVYSKNQYAEVQYLTNTNVATLLSYFVSGENILSTLSSSKALAASRSAEVLLNFLKSAQKTLTQAKIDNILVNQTIYTLSVINFDGTYSAQIQDKGVLNLIDFSKLSAQTCYDMKIDQIQNSQKIKAIDKFLRENYPLQGFNIQLIQLNVKVSSFVYRFLYANQKIKQIEIYIEERESDSTANVIKASYINYGYEIVDPADPKNTNYLTIVDTLRTSNLQGSKIPFFTQVNGTVINSYYDDGKSTTSILFDKSTNKSTISVISTRSYLLVPDGFSITSLLIPGTPSATDSAALTKITTEILKKYSVILKDSTLVFADRVKNSFNIMFKNVNGFQKIDATIDDKGGIVVGRLIITGYRDGDFSNCKKYSSIGKCLSCDPQGQVQYQGACFKKIEGCLIQPGSICVKCNANYVKSSQRCYDQCNNFFN